MNESNDSLCRVKANNSRGTHIIPIHPPNPHMTPDANRNYLTELLITHLLLGPEASDTSASLENTPTTATHLQAQRDDAEPSEETPQP